MENYCDATNLNEFLRNQKGIIERANWETSKEKCLTLAGSKILEFIMIKSLHFFNRLVSIFHSENLLANSPVIFFAVYSWVKFDEHSTNNLPILAALRRVLHHTMNEKLIKEVFSKMAEYKPSIQKHLIADEPGEETDFRAPGDLIIRSLLFKFPDFYVNSPI